MNEPVRKLLVSGVSQRRIARLLGLNLKTIARKLVFLGEEAKQSHMLFLKFRSESQRKVKSFDFDEMETFEISKCLPLSIPLAVEKKSRKILGFRVCSMPAKGPLAVTSLRKYGPRVDERPEAAYSLFNEISFAIASSAQITSDQKSCYPSWLKPHFPKATHTAIKGRRGCVAGQGELKKIGFDPLFEFNHTAAMLRANVNRLFRRTWCSTKRRDRLEMHIALYVQYHNTELLPAKA